MVDWATVSDLVVRGIFVVLGVWALVASRFRNLTGPVMVIAIAGAFLLRNLGVLPEGFIGTWWPLAFVLLGVLLLNRERRKHWRTTHVEGSEDITVVSVFGGSHVDLHDAEVDSPPAVLELLSLFGGTEVTVPEDWDVRIDILALFGGTDDDRRAPPRRTHRIWW